MPYTQTPGRGNNPKTGDGLPVGLTSGSAANATIDPKKKPVANTEIEKTTDYTRNQKKTVASIENSKGVYGETTKNATTGMQEANSYTKKYVKGKNEYQGDRVIDTKTGKVEQTSSTFSGSSNKRGMSGYYDKAQAKTKNDLYEGYKKDSTMTMNSRNKFANYTNIRTGAKQDLTESDKQNLIQFGLAKKVN